MYNNLGNQSGVFSKKLENKSKLRFSHTPLGYIPKKCPTMPQRHILSYVHSNIISDRQKLEITHLGRTDTENVVHLHNGILFNY